MQKTFQTYARTQAIRSFKLVILGVTIIVAAIAGINVIQDFMSQPVALSSGLWQNGTIKTHSAIYIKLAQDEYFTGKAFALENLDTIIPGTTTFYTDGVVSQSSILKGLGGSDLDWTEVKPGLINFTIPNDTIFPGIPLHYEVSREGVLTMSCDTTLLYTAPGGRIDIKHDLIYDLTLTKID